MEEDKSIKRKRIWKTITKTISYTIIIILMIIASFFIFYVISGKLAEKQGKTPPFGLYTIISPSMTPNIKVYDVVFVKKVDTNNLKVNDVITFYSTNAFFGGTPITHRIVEILDVPESGTMYRVKGDANEDADEEKVLPSNVIGKVLFRIPNLGKLQFFLASKTGWLVAILIPAVVILIYDIYKLIKLIMVKKKLDKYSPNSI
jgi:signal peptidase